MRKALELHCVNGRHDRTGAGRLNPTMTIVSPQARSIRPAAEPACDAEDSGSRRENDSGDEESGAMRNRERRTARHLPGEESQPHSEMREARENRRAILPRSNGPLSAVAAVCVRRHYWRRSLVGRDTVRFVGGIQTGSMSSSICHRFP